MSCSASPSARASEFRGAVRNLDRRRVLAGLSLLLAGPAGAQAQDRHSVIVVSRSRILRETTAGQALREAEAKQSATFQARLDAVKAQLEVEEQELATLRGTLSRGAFEARATAFDTKVRLTRRASQRQSAELQRIFRRARERLNSALGPILIEVLRETGADIVLDADQILVAAPSVDMTDRVIALYNARIPAPIIEELPEAPLLEEESGPADPVAGPEPAVAPD